MIIADRSRWNETTRVLEIANQDSIQTMGLDNEFTAALNEFIQFLESLNDVRLPERLEGVREQLLSKFKNKLSSLESQEYFPEGYLDMTFKSGHPQITQINCATEVPDQREIYVNQEPLYQEGQCTYETLQDLSFSPDLKSEENSSPNFTYETEDDNLIDAYTDFTIAQTESQCDKCGHLQVKKKLKLLGTLEVGRTVFVGLIGNHLLIYGNDKNRPSCVIQLRGYQARISISKNQKPAENTFEICRPGDRTLKFIANDPKEMMEWIFAISQIARYENEKCQTKSRKSSEMVNSRSSLDSISVEKYQDVGPSNLDFSKPSKDVTNDQSSLKSFNSDIPVILPNRSNRVLPKLPLPKVPTEKAKLSEDKFNNQGMKLCVDDCDENYYHRIEDFRKENYQNCMVIHKMETEKLKDSNKKNKKIPLINGNAKTDSMERYDDISSIVSKQGKETANGVTKTDEKSKKEMNETKSPSKLRPKRSFLDRVRRKSFKSVENPAKLEAVEIPCTANSDPEDQPIYLMPPKPRPVIPLPQIPCEVSEESYDDIQNCRKMVQEKEERLKNSLDNTLTYQDIDLQTDNNGASSQYDDEEEETEGIYDDVDILIDFRNRQQQPPTSPNKKTWPRFGSEKKKIFDITNSTDLTKSESTEPDSSTEPATLKPNAEFKNLINKIQNSLGKTPIKVQFSS